jgi:hypothetical protein
VNDENALIYVGRKEATDFQFDKKRYKLRPDGREWTSGWLFESERDK